MTSLYKAHFVTTMETGWRAASPVPNHAHESRRGPNPQMSALLGCVESNTDIFSAERASEAFKKNRDARKALLAEALKAEAC
jgi:hypothetical protein